MTPADVQYQDEIMCSCDLDLDPSITALQTDRQTKMLPKTLQRRIGGWHLAVRVL